MRIWMVSALLASFLVPCAPVASAGPDRVVKVGVFSFLPTNELHVVERALQNTLAARRDTPGVSYRVVAVNATYDERAMLDAGDRLLAARPDIILTDAPISIYGLMDRNRDIPIVTGGEVIIDTLPLIDIESVARPGGRVTGFLRQANRISKRAELLRSFCPAVRRVAYVASAPSSGDRVFLDNLRDEQAVLGPSGIDLEPVYLDGAGSVEALRERIQHGRFDAVDIPLSTVVIPRVDEFLRMLDGLRIPYVSNRKPAFDAGAALVAQPAPFDFAQTGAEFVARIVNGERPGEIPLRISRAYEIFVNVEKVKQFKGCDARRIAKIATRFYP